MKTVKRVLLALALLMAGVVLGAFIPVFPVNHEALGDPIGPTDPRVRAELSEADLRLVLRIVRRGRLNSVYEILRYQTRKAFLGIAVSGPSYQIHPTTIEIPPLGDINATVGYVCGELCGRGVTYYLRRTSDGWEVVDIQEWIS